MKTLLHYWLHPREDHDEVIGLPNLKHLAHLHLTVQGTKASITLGDLLNVTHPRSRGTLTGTRACSFSGMSELFVVLA